MLYKTSVYSLHVSDHQDQRLEERFIFEQDNDLKPNTVQEWIWDKSANDTSGPILEPAPTSRERPKYSGAAMLLIQPDRD